MEQQKLELKQDLKFVLAFVKVLLETEAPTSKLRSLLLSAHIHSPESVELLDYIEIVEAKNLLRKSANDSGEALLKNVLKRAPGNAHAHFMLGAHMFWVDNDTIHAVSHLETSVRLHPGFLRAWGCLGAIYKKLGNAPLSRMAFQKCLELETNPSMRQFFESQAQ